MMTWSLSSAMQSLVNTSCFLSIMIGQTSYHSIGVGLAYCTITYPLTKLLFCLVDYLSGSKCQQQFTSEIGSSVPGKLELRAPLYRWERGRHGPWIQSGTGVVGFHAAPKIECKSATIPRLPTNCLRSGVLCDRFNNIPTRKRGSEGGKGG